MARKSFMMHRDLACQYGKKYMYRPTAAYNVTSKYTSDPSKSMRAKEKDLQWMDCEIIEGYPIGTRETNAQLHPRLFCETLVELMGDRVTIKKGAVTSMARDPDDPQRVVGVILKSIDSDINTIYDHSDFFEGYSPEISEVIACDAVVIAMGPWTYLAAEWFPQCKQLSFIRGGKCNSIVVQPTFDDENENENESKESEKLNESKKVKKSSVNVMNADDIKMNDTNGSKGNNEKIEDNVQCFDGPLFLTHEGPDGKLLGDDEGIEVYPRPDGTVYSCCHSNGVPLPSDPFQIKDISNEEEDSQMIHEGLKQLSSKYMAKSKILAKQACYVPRSADSIPLIGPITGCSNAFVGAGHSCWGILNAPATGLVLSEMIADAKVTSFSYKAVKKWDPSRI